MLGRVVVFQILALAVQSGELVEQRCAGRAEKPALALDHDQVGVLRERAGRRTGLQAAVTSSAGDGGNHRRPASTGQADRRR